MEFTGRHLTIIILGILKSANEIKKYTRTSRRRKRKTAPAQKVLRPERVIIAVEHTDYIL